MLDSAAVDECAWVCRHPPTDGHRQVQTTNSEFMHRYIHLSICNFVCVQASYLDSWLGKQGVYVCVCVCMCVCV